MLKVPDTAQEWAVFLDEMGWRPVTAIDDKVVIVVGEQAIHLTPAFLRRLHLLDEEFADTTLDPTDVMGDFLYKLFDNADLQAALKVLSDFDMFAVNYHKPVLNDGQGYTVTGGSSS